MNLQATIREMIGENKTPSGLPLEVPKGARILIVSDDADAEPLKAILREAGFIPEVARSMTAGCAAAKSGRFQVVLSTPLLDDGSWRRLIDIANHYDLGFEVVLWARNFDLHDWAQSMNDGAFDVLDALSELPRTVEVVKTALWSAYLSGAGPNHTAASPLGDERFAPGPPPGHLPPLDSDTTTRQHVFRGA